VLRPISSTACDEVYRGLVQPGGDCGNSRECSNGYCASPPGVAGCNGQCTAFLAEGEACRFGHGGCDPVKDYCPSPSTPVCTPRTVVAASEVCSDFASGTPCADGLRCQNSICTTAGAEGQVCGSSSDCAGSLYCFEGVCRPMIAAGRDCSALDSCEDGLVCVGNYTDCPGDSGSRFPSCLRGTCTKVPDIGDVCEQTTGSCPLSAYCDLTSGKCEPLLGVGTPCGGAASCRSGRGPGLPLYCDAATQTCAAKLLPGAPCTPAVGGADDPCATYCDRATVTCAPVPPSPWCSWPIG
jgi:hypothetical protein